MTIKFIEGPHASRRKGKPCLPKKVTVADIDTHPLAAKAKNAIDEKNIYYDNKNNGKEHSVGIASEHSESKKPPKNK